MTDRLVSIQKLMEQRRFDEAEAALTEFVQTEEFVEAQAGGAYLTLLMTYMETLIGARRQYNQALDVGIALLKAANSREREMMEMIDLERLNKEIAALKAQARV